MGQRGIAVWAGAWLLSACTTAPLVPDIETFGETVEDIVTEDARSAEGRSLDARVAAARLEDFARAGIRFGTGEFGSRNAEACAYIRPDLDRDPEPFREACRLIPQDAAFRTAASVYDPPVVQAAAQVIVSAGDTALYREFLGFGIRTDLAAYAAALADLAKTDAPEDLGRAAGAAFGAVTELRDALSAAASETGTPAPPPPRRRPATTLIPMLAEETAELLRIRRLKKVLQLAAPAVETASVQLAVLAHEGEADGLKDKAAALTAEIEAEDMGSLRNLRAVEAAWAALAEADAAADFRRYAEIGRAHRAILAALEEPASFERLSEANERIVALAEAVVEVIEADE